MAIWFIISATPTSNSLENIMRNRTDEEHTRRLTEEHTCTRRLTEEHTRRLTEDIKRIHMERDQQRNAKFKIKQPRQRQVGNKEQLASKVVLNHSFSKHSLSYQGPSNHGSSYQGSSNHGSSYQGPSNHGSSYQGPSNHGSSYQGPSNHGSSNQGPTNHGSSCQGTSDQSSSNQGSPKQSSLHNKGSSTHGLFKQGPAKPDKQNIPKPMNLQPPNNNNSLSFPVCNVFPGMMNPFSYPFMPMPMYVPPMPSFNTPCTDTAAQHRMRDMMPTYPPVIPRNLPSAVTGTIPGVWSGMMPAFPILGDSLQPPPFMMLPGMMYPDTSMENNFPAQHPTGVSGTQFNHRRSTPRFSSFVAQQSTADMPSINPLDLTYAPTVADSTQIATTETAVHDYSQMMLQSFPPDILEPMQPLNIAQHSATRDDGLYIKQEPPETAEPPQSL